MELTKGYCDFLILCYNIIIDYSPEIDKYLRINCFPTFNGHCGCLMFDVTEPKMTGEKTMAEKAVIMYLITKMME